MLRSCTTALLVLFAGTLRAGEDDALEKEFDEGCALYYGSAEARFSGGLRPGAASVAALRVLEPRAEELVPLKELCLLDPSEFMEKPDLRYAQSWLVIHFLRETGNRRYRDVLEEDLAAVCRGASKEEAYRGVIEPLERGIQAGCRAHLRELRKGR